VVGLCRRQDARALKKHPLHRSARALGPALPLHVAPPTILDIDSTGRTDRQRQMCLSDALGCGEGRAHVAQEAMGRRKGGHRGRAFAAPMEST
jgi:hypothetical protein